MHIYTGRFIQISDPKVRTGAFGTGLEHGSEALIYCRHARPGAPTEIEAIKFEVALKEQLVDQLGQFGRVGNFAHHPNLWPTVNVNLDGNKVLFARFDFPRGKFDGVRDYLNHQ